jgi:hypothetical protein
VRTWSSLVAVVVLTAAVAHAASFYGVIRITNDGIPESGVALSTSLIDFLAPAGPPNGQAIVQMSASSDNNGPIPGSPVLVKDLTPGSFVTGLFTFPTWSAPGFNGGFTNPRWSGWDPFSPFEPPYFVDPTGCTVNPSPFCVMDYPLGGSIVFFELSGSTPGQLGRFDALFGALLPGQSPAQVIALLEGGQTLVSDTWTADVTTSPEPATSTALVTSICLLIVVKRRFRVRGAL